MTITIHPLPPAGYSPLSQGESKLLLANANKMAPRNVMPSLFCMHLRRGVSTVYSLQSTVRFSFVHPRFIPQLSGTP